MTITTLRRGPSILASTLGIALAVLTVPGYPGESAAASTHQAQTAQQSAKAAGHAPVGVEDFEFASFEADYHLGIDAGGHSTLRTVETIVAMFPEFDQNRGIIRAIPNYYDGVPLETQIAGVVDENGDPVPYEIERVAEFTELALGTDEFVHGRTTYVIEYEQRNVVRSFSDTGADEFYWDVNGTGWAQPFGSVTARVHVDAAAAGVLSGDAACYLGVLGSGEQCEIESTETDSGVVFTATGRELGPFETLTVAIGFEAGTFTQVAPVPIPGGPGGPGTGLPDYPPPFTPVSGSAWLIDVATYGSITLILLGIAGTAVWRFRRPASSKGTGIIVPQYTEPKGITVLESAELIGRGRYGVAAQIVSLAVRGKLRILDYPVTSSGARYTLQLIDIRELEGHERDLVRALFGGLEVGALQEVGVEDDTAAAAVAGVTTRVRDSLVERGLLLKRSAAVGIVTAVGMFVMSFVSMGIFMLSVSSGHVNAWGVAGFMLAIVGIFVCIGLSFRRPLPTGEGVVLAEYLQGVRDYLQLAEADRLRMLQSPEGALRVKAEGLDPSFPAQRVKLYERLLPFAVLWGVERDWAGELTILYGDSAPDWFVSAGSFDASSFSVALGSIAVAQVVSRTPSSSGSSWSGSSGGSFSGGSTGGGFSGGGGGGGGGGGR